MTQTYNDFHISYESTLVELRGSYYDEAKERKYDEVSIKLWATIPINGFLCMSVCKHVCLYTLRIHMDVIIPI